MSLTASEIFENCEVLVAVPVLNEEVNIAACLRSLLLQDCANSFRVVVADGGSTDRTCELVRELQREFGNLYLVSNSRRIQSAAVNLVARSQYPGEILVRADAHALYPNNFIRICIANLIAENATSVVVPMRTLGKTPFQRSVAAAQNSLFGNGGAAHRRAGMSGFVDHGHHAAFQRSFFLKIGGYDEAFRFNEDAEFDARARKEGGRIWLCAEAGITYFPRATVGSLARQYRNHGCGRAETILRHRTLPKARQLAPVGIAAVLFGGLIWALFWPPASLFAIAVIGVYVAFGIWQAFKTGDASQMGAGLAAAVMHFSWAWGFTKRLALSLSRGGQPTRPLSWLADETLVGRSGDAADVS